MQGKAKDRSAASPGLSGRPALAAFLLVGAGVAVAHPLDGQRLTKAPAQPLPLKPILRAATVRIELPRRASIAPARRVEAVGIVRVPLEHLAALPPAKVTATGLTVPAARPADAGAAALPNLPTAAMPAVEVQGLAAARAKAETAYSAVQHPIAEIAAPKPLSMVGDDNWIELTRSYSKSDPARSATDRSAALQPPPARARPLAGAVAIPLDPAPQASTAALVASASPAAKPREIANVSFDVAIKINGTAAGRVPLLIRDDANISVRLTDLLTTLKPKIDADLYDRLSGSSAAQSYITFNELRAAGIAVRFDDRDQLLIGLR